MCASRRACTLLGWAALVVALAAAGADAQTSDAFAAGWLDLLQEHFPAELAECDWAALKASVLPWRGGSGRGGARRRAR